MMSQYKIFVSVFWFLKLRLLRRNEDSFVRVLINVISQTNYKFSFINHFLHKSESLITVLVNKNWNELSLCKEVVEVHDDDSWHIV